MWWTYYSINLAIFVLISFFHFTIFNSICLIVFLLSSLCLLPFPLFFLRHIFSVFSNLIFSMVRSQWLVIRIALFGSFTFASGSENKLSTSIFQQIKSAMFMDSSLSTWIKVVQGKSTNLVQPLP